MQKLDFAYFTGKYPCLFLSHPQAVFGRKLFWTSRLGKRPRTGPLLDKSLKPGVRPALAITRKDGR
jgi:hypothetical protein